MTKSPEISDTLTNMSKLLTAEQAAAYYQVSKRTLANWEKSGQIATVRVGGIVRYKITESNTKENSKNG